MRILVIGGVAGGATAAARLRRLSEDAEIIIFEKGDYISFANCGLPYHIGGIIEDRERLLLETPQSFKEKLNIDVRVNNEVIEIKPENKTVKIKKLKSDEIYEEKYDYLILSPGAKPFIPNIEGVSAYNVFTLRNINDMDKIKDYVKHNNVKNALVVGGGFIGVEVAENLVHKNINVSLVEMADQILINLDKDIASVLHNHAMDNDLNLYLGNSLVKVDSVDKKAVLKNGEVLDADIIILATGVKPETELALKAGIEVGRGGIKVNEYLQTSDKYIYAVGDAVEVYNPLLGADTLIPLASPANRQGRIAATNIIRDNCDKYEGAFGTSIIKFFDMTAASAGLNEKRLNSMGIKYFKSITHGNSNAGYYPGAMPLTIKLLFSEDGKILGGQVIGFKGVDKRIDVISTSIKAGLRVEDLETLELAYAPPFGSAKDPVNIAGYVANNILKKDVEVINIEDLKTDDDNYCILDIRTDEEQSLGKIESEYSLHIPLNDLRNRLDEIPKNKVIVTYCQVGLRGYLAYRILKNKDFNVKNLNGGFKLYTYYNQKISVKENKKESQKIDFKVQDKNVLRLDACGLQCPGPIMETYKKMNNMQNGEVIEIKATDPGFKKDIVKWAEKTGNKVLDVNSENGVITAKLIKGEPVVKGNTDNQNDNKTIVVFSNDLDRALASFVIANGAAAMGKKVTMFFTFWGLNILRKENFKVSGKTFVEKMFGNMMPQGPGKLKLSKLNMAGMGTSMMKKVMKQKNIDSLEKMINSALENGITLMACQMSMDMMGIKKEELIDKVEVGGVASYLAETEESNLNLFI